MVNTVPTMRLNIIVSAMETQNASWISGITLGRKYSVGTMVSPII